MYAEDKKTNIHSFPAKELSKFRHTLLLHSTNLVMKLSVAIPYDVTAAIIMMSEVP